MFFFFFFTEHVGLDRRAYYSKINRLLKKLAAVAALSTTVPISGLQYTPDYIRLVMYFG